MAKKKAPIIEDEKVKTFVDMIAPSIIKFNTDHFICGNTYRCVWALREYPTSTSEQAILRHLGEKDGVTLRIYTRQVTPNEEKKIIHNAANKNRMNTANTNDLQQTVTAESNLQDVITLVSTMHRNRLNFRENNPSLTWIWSIRLSPFSRSSLANGSDCLDQNE